MAGQDLGWKEGQNNLERSGKIKEDTFFIIVSLQLFIFHLAFQ